MCLLALALRAPIQTIEPLNEGNRGECTSPSLPLSYPAFLPPPCLEMLMPMDSRRSRLDPSCPSQYSTNIKFAPSDHLQIVSIEASRECLFSTHLDR
jgi:hypothetical protein